MYLRLYMKNLGPLNINSINFPWKSWLILLERKQLGQFSCHKWCHFHTYCK